MVAAAVLDFGKCQSLRIGYSYMRKIWWADTSRSCGDHTRPKLKTGTFLRDVIVAVNKDVYIKQMSGT